MEYYEHDQLFQKIAESLQNAEKTHITANFPIIAYTKELLAGLHREAYAETLWQKSNKEKKLQIHILTDLNIDALFNHAFRVHEDPKLAYLESQTTLNKLQTQIQKNPKLDIRHTQDPHGLDTIIIQQKEPTEFYLLTRDEHGDITSGLHIKHKQTTQNALQQFQHTYEYAEKLNTPQGQKTLQTLHQTLKQKYGTLE